MKKKVFVLGILLLTIFSMTGCVFNKAKETTKKTDIGDDEIKLYSDDKKIVFMLRTTRISAEWSVISGFQNTSEKIAVKFSKKHSD